MDRLFTGRQIINSENHLREFMAFFENFFWPKVVISTVFAFYVPIIPEI